MHLHLDNPFQRRCFTDSGCQAPTCFCSPGQTCVLTTQTCDTCATFKCVDPAPAPTGKKGPSSGAVAGAVIAVVLALAAVLGLFFWYRRRTGRSAARLPQSKESVAAASDVLNRPDPNEKAIEQAHAQAVAASRTASARSVPSRAPSNSRFVEHTSEYYAEQQQRSAASSRGQSPQALAPTHSHQPSRPSPTPPHAHLYAQVDPFSDTQSIQTTTTGTLDAIPIALVPRSPGGTPLTESRALEQQQQHLNLEHLNVSKDTFSTSATGLAPAYERSAAATNGNMPRNSYMSSLTTATDLLNEAPVIVTQSQRQVLGISKAEVLRTVPPTPNTPQSADSTRAHPPSLLRPSMRSPLAATSFGPHDVVRESDEGHDPFGDEHSPFARPTSMATVATGVGTIIADISSATRVTVGMARSASVKSAGARTIHRMTSGKLVSPSPERSPGADDGTLQQQQERALAIAHAKAREQGGVDPLSRRVSGSSVLTTSTRADSILESFPFVPPSPLSSLPMRTPPRSPLGQQAFAAPPVPALPEARPQAPLAPNRAQRGLSSASQFSTASTGLGAFTFQLAEDAPPSPMPPSAFQQQQQPTPAGQRQRASLDTLALTSALSSYPLDGFAQAEAHYPPRN